MPSIAEAKKKPVKVDVMTRNLYLGAVLDPIIAAPEIPAAARIAAGDVYKIVQDTNIVARAKLLAQEIKDADPDLIGLQEVAIWRRGQRGEADGATTPSQEVVYDYLELLQDELKRRGPELQGRLAPAGGRHRSADLDQRRRRRRVRREAHHAGRDSRQEGREDVERKSENYETRLENIPVQGAGTVMSCADTTR